MIENCVIADNVAARRGGGMYIGYDKSAVVVRNCLITGNSGSAGGGIYNTFGSTSVLNTSIINNTKVISGGGIHNEGGEPILNNCVLWGNEAISGPQIFIQGPILTIDHSNVQGGHPGEGNIESDPMFLDAGGGDLRLRSESPCIDAGHNDAIPEGVTIDLAGHPRFADHACADDAGNPGIPPRPIVDLGAYEVPHQTACGDGVRDGDESFETFACDCDRCCADGGRAGSDTLLTRHA